MIRTRFCGKAVLWALCLLLPGQGFFCAPSAQPEQPASPIRYTGGGPYTLIERANVRRYDNDAYTGLVSREARAFIAPDSGTAEHKRYTGSFFVLEETKSDARSAAKGINAVVPADFYIDAEGGMTVLTDKGYPAYRSFPSFPAEALKPGDSWTAEAQRSVDPLNTLRFTVLPVLAEYVFAGEEEYKGEPVYRIRAKWATRYGNVHGGGFDPKGDPDLIQAFGTHDADIIVRKATGETILIRDTMDETFVYKDGHKVSFRGTSLLFTKFPPAVNRGAVLPALQRIAAVSGAPAAAAPVAGTGNISDTAASSASGTDAGESSDLGYGRTPPVPDRIGDGADGKTAVKNNILVEETNFGLRLSVQNIRFQPDSASILPEERRRLDEIAEVLKLTGEDTDFLIEGHTASTGKPEGEKKLSLERARSIADELSKRGIDAGRFMCTGYGGTRPIADNGSAEGRAQNRRVEITILE